MIKQEGRSPKPQFNFKNLYRIPIIIDVEVEQESPHFSICKPLYQMRVFSTGKFLMGKLVLIILQSFVQ